MTALDLGVVVGSGIFTVLGTAIGGNPATTATSTESPVIDLVWGALHRGSGLFAGRPGAGPALVISLVLVAIVCALTGLCYAELASMIPIAGSAYTYSYAILGEIFAWIIGWDLILEYAFADMSVSVGFASHLVNLLDWFGIHLDPKWLEPAYLPLGAQDLAGKDIFAPGLHFGFNIPAFLIVLALTVLLVRGVRESARTNNIMVLLKIGAILIFVFFGMSFIKPANYHPFAPTGFAGILAGGSIIFFTYIGFDRFRGMQASATKRADRPTGHSACVHNPLYRCGCRSDRHCSLAIHCERWRTDRQRPTASGSGARCTPFALDSLGCALRGNLGNDLIHSGSAIRTGEDLVCDE